MKKGNEKKRQKVLKEMDEFIKMINEKEDKVIPSKSIPFNGPYKGRKK